MLKKNDLILLLTNLQEQGVDVAAKLRKVISSPDIPLDVVKFINDNRQMDVTRFYEQIRKSYNAKRSSLYINLVKEELSNPTDSLTTLASFNLQVLLFAKHLDNPAMFLRQSRVEEVTRVLNNYYRTYDLGPVVKLRALIKSDIKAFESIR